MLALIGRRDVFTCRYRRGRVVLLLGCCLIVAACSSDVTQSEEYQALETELNDLASSQAATERQLEDVESQLASTEDQIQSVQERLAEAEERNLELESLVRMFEQGLPVENGEDSPNAQPNPEGGVTIYGDGEISCPDHRADDDSLPVGTIVFQPDEGEIRIILTLTDAAPNVSYGVELWSDESCQRGALFEFLDVIETDDNGAAELDYLLTGVERGTHALNVNLSTGDPHQDPRHREMGTAQFTEVTVP